MHEAMVGENLRDAGRAFRSLDFYMVLFGLALCRAWIILCLSLPVRSAETMDWTFLLPGGAVMLAVSLASLRWSKGEAATRLEKRFKVAAGVLVGLCVALSPLALSTANPLLLLGFMIACGIASCCLQVLWGIGFARRQLTFSIYCYPASAVATALLVAVALADPGIMAFCVFPVASFLLLLVSTSADYRGGFEAPAAPDQSPLPVPTIVRLLVSIAVFSFLCRLYDDLPGGLATDPLAPLGDSSVAALVVAGVGFLAFAMLVGRRFNPLLGYRIALPLMALGMTIVALFFWNHWYLSVLIIGIGYELFDTLAWILLVTLAQREAERFTPLAVFGLGTAATMLGMGVGRFAGTWMAQVAAAGASEVSAVGVIGIMALVLTAFLIIPEGTFAQIAGRKSSGSDRARGEEGTDGALPTSAGSASRGAVPPMEAACNTIARRYRLTPRETEVLQLLARGRTLAIVMRDLGIAKGTAQTHMENVYQKLGVHKQQELIDLVESHISQP